MTSLQKGNSTGALAIVLWSSLALFTVSTGAIPPLQLTFMTFSVAFCIGLAWWLKEGAHLSIFKAIPWRVWCLGVGGLFGYHFFYFLALKKAPALEANLINYLWPLLIVLFSAFLPNEKLRWYHVLGALCGFSGAFLLIGGKGVVFSVEYAEGYFYALLCAFVWSGYSVLSRYFGEIPTVAVGGFCGVTAVLSLGAHLVLEETYIPSYTEFFSALGLGLGPVGFAFFVWDYGVKKGDIKFIGALSYLTPLLSTLLLVFFGRAVPHESIWIACGLIMGGSLISSMEFLRFKTRNRPLL